MSMLFRIGPVDLTVEDKFDTCFFFFFFVYGALGIVVKFLVKGFFDVE
jgi:hypothetical protein